MKLNYWIAFLILTIILFACIELSMASVNVSNATFTANYTEPTTNIDTSPLSDLDYTTIYYRINTAVRVKAVDIPATSINGGGVINESFTIEGLIGKETNVVIIYTATDLSGNESEEFVEPTIRIDQLTPSIPQG